VTGGTPLAGIQFFRYSDVMRKVQVALLVCAAGVLWGATLASASLGSSVAPACVRASSRQVGKGGLPEGGTWTVRASIRDNLTCETWLFGVTFYLGEFGVGGGGTAIPSGGRIPRGYLEVEPMEVENSAGTESVIYGVAEIHAVRLIAMTTTGKKFSLPTVLPPPRVRIQAPWLHGFRYFMLFHPAGEYVRELVALSQGGKVLERVGPHRITFVDR
jgi:hypothetical protein